MVRLLLTVVATLLLLVVVRWSQPDALRVDGFWSLAAVALVTAAGAALTLRLSRVLFTRLAPWVRGVLSTAVAFALVASFTGDFGPVVIVGAVLLALSLLFSLLRGGTVAGGTLVTGAVLALTRPWHAAVTPVTVDGAVRAACGGLGHLVGIGDPHTGTDLRVMGSSGVLLDLAGFLPDPTPDAVRRQAGRLTPGLVRALCAVAVARDDGGRALVAAAYTDGGIRVWDPADGRPILQIAAHSSSVNALCAGTVDGAGWLASAANDGTVCLWDLVTGKALGSFDDSSPRYALCPARPTGWIRSMCQVGSADDAFLMFAGYDRAVGQIRLRPALQDLA
ncbi:hypothetical protein ABUL04_14640 [Micromonospora harpali]|uniref:WD40 repeat domain-containing protein n=1 Tax=Micromonospora harpali TaxID=1490225 RepID=A0ABW1HVV4_9ACTN